MSSKSTHIPLYALAIGCFAIGIAGCHGNNQNNENQAQTQNAVATQAADESQDPAEQANLAPAASTTESAQQQEAPPPPSENQDYAYNAPEDYEPVTYAPDPPPPLPDYDQPEAPAPDYIWTPGYWDYGNGGYGNGGYGNSGYNNTGYYWVPGAWVLAPYTGALWTPGYWGYYNNRYLWHRGYWGPHIGFYGGVNYGYGYTGVGYVGGYWNNDQFRYNTAVTRVNPATIHDTYSHRVRVVTSPRISYNGGRGGISARPLTAERVASREQHIAPLPAQMTHREQASNNRSQWASQNHGRPQTMVVSQPLNHGRQAPAPMPQQIRAQVQHERAGHPPEARTAPTHAPSENRPGQPQAQNQPHNQMRPAENHPAARNENHAAPRTETRQDRPATRNEARPTANHPATRPETHTQANHPETRTQPHTQARSTEHTATVHPAHTQTRSTEHTATVHSQKPPDARHSTKEQDHRTQEKREQPRNDDNNPQA